MRDARTVEGVLVDDPLRFVDVLLEEELGAPRVGAAVPARRMPWLAAALVLLGLGVLVGATLLRSDGAAPAQGPVVKPPTATPFVPKDAADLAAFLQNVVAVRVQPLHEVRGMFGPEWVTLPGSEAVESDAGRLRECRSAWEKGMLREPVAAATVRVLWSAEGGRQLEVCYDDPNELRIGDTAWSPGPATARALRRLADLAAQNEAATRGRATTIDELRALPVTVRWLSCECGTADELQEQLPRFRQLFALQLVIRADDRTATVLGSLPELRELALFSPDFTEAGWARVAGLGHLRSLQIEGSLAGLTPEVLARIGARLERLVIVGGGGDSFPVWQKFLPAILGMHQLQELQGAVDFNWQGKVVDHGALLKSLFTMPELRRLAFTARNCEPRFWWPALAESRIEKLRIAGTELDAEAVRNLAAITTLRELDVRCLHGSAEARVAMTGMRRLTRLDVSGSGISAQHLAALRTALPHCLVLGQAGITGHLYFSGLGGDPSWTRDD